MDPAAQPSYIAMDSPHPFKFGAPIPSLLWETVEEALRANMRLLAKDIAATLGQPEKPLLDALKEGSIRPYIFEEVADKDVGMRCQHVCQRPEAAHILQPCGQPVFWNGTGSPRCTEHLYAKPVGPPVGLVNLTPLQMDFLEEEESSPLFRMDDGTVTDGTGKVRGRYNPTSKRLRLFRDLDSV